MRADDTVVAMTAHGDDSVVAMIRALMSLPLLWYERWKTVNMIRALFNSGFYIHCVNNDGSLHLYFVKCLVKLTDGQASRQTDRQAGRRQAGRQTARETGRFHVRDEAIQIEKKRVTRHHPRWTVLSPRCWSRDICHPACCNRVICHHPRWSWSLRVVISVHAPCRQQKCLAFDQQ